MSKLQLSRKPRGFSLIEVLIAVVVLSLGLLALASLQVSLIRSGAESKAQSLALAAAKQKLDLLQSAESFGGTDNTCVSPSAWAAGQVSCYRAITDEAMPTTFNVDGDPTITGIQPLGGVEFRLGTVVTRYVFNKTTDAYDDSVADTALSTSVNAATYLPGKEFKRIVVSVSWTDSAGSAQTISVEDAVPGVVPRDSIALLLGKKGVQPRKAEAIIVNPGSVAGVIPIAVGNGSNTAASNPTPVLIGQQSNQYAETRFDVYTYIPLSATTALAQARVETTVAPCSCSTANASTSETPLRPTYWNGVRYAIPTEANYVGLTASAVTKNRPLAGPKAGVSQSEQCRVCCRDHFDPSGNDANGDARSAVAKFSPRRTNHTHYLVTSATLGSAVSSGDYSDVCRLIRVDGIFRVAADFNNDYFALLDARNTGVSPFVPSTDVSDDYGDMVKKYLSDRFSENTATSSTYNNASSPSPYSTTYSQGSRTLLPGNTTRAYDLDSPALAYMKLSADARWLHARGLYVDYLEPEAIAKIDAAKTTCSAVDPNECVLPYLPFTSVNLSELADWVDVPVLPASTASKAVVDVMNRGFDLAIGDTTYTRSTGNQTSTAGSYTIYFENSVGALIVPGLAISGTGVAANARVATVAGSGRSLTVDLPNAAAISEGTTITFQGAPVRGRATPGTSLSAGNQADAKATATYNNAAIALSFPMNPQDVALTDAQRFEFSVGGSPPDPTAGSFFVSGFSVDGGAVLQPDAVGPKVYWGIGNNSPSVTANCDLTASTYPFNCPVTSGLGPTYPGMTIRIENYNRYVKASVSTIDYPTSIAVSSCRWKNGSTVGAGTLFADQAATVTVKQAYVRNYAVSSAMLPGSSITIATAQNTPQPATQNLNETTEIRLNPVLKSPTQTVQINLSQEANVMADYLCCVATKESGNTFKFDHAEFATPTVQTCSLTP